MPPTDYIIFCITVTLVAGTVLGWMMWRKIFPLLAVSAGILTVALLISAWVFTEQAEHEEKERLQETLSGLAPTYAAEIQRMGHRSLTFETPEDDPTYLEIIEAEKRWLKANPRIASMYTYRLDSEEKLRFVVACETDYDRNGKIEGDDEARVAIGEVYDEEDASMVAAFRGNASFGEEPEQDRWGTWVAAYHPLRDEAGNIEAVVGLDLDAGEWVGLISRARLSVLVAFGLGAILGLGLLAGAGMWVLAKEQTAQLREAAALRAERVKFETLVDSIDGVVFEALPQNGQFTYTSRQAESLLGCPPQAWTETPDFLAQRMHPEDRDWAEPARAQAMAAGKPYMLEYRLLAADGKTVWVRERGTLATAAGDQSAASVIRGILIDITAQKASASELESTHSQLMIASRQAGMAEVATGVLHNVGNVLNSVNISSTVIHDQLRQSRVSFLQQLSELIDAQGDQLPAFIRDDERGRLIPGFIRDLAAQITSEHEMIGVELTALVKSVEHIKEIVLMQQDYARLSGRTEKLDVASLLDDALQINESAFTRHRIRVIKHIENTPPVLAERGKVLQILVNLIRNAKHALDEGREQDRVLTLFVSKNGGSHVKIGVQDNGVGIAPEILPRICTYGFTTKSNGHGFGLHSGATAARDMGGSLTVASAGTGLGATFTLELPAAPAEPATALTNQN